MSLGRDYPQINQQNNELLKREIEKYAKDIGKGFNYNVNY